MRGKRLFKKSYSFNGTRSWIWRIADMSGDIITTGRALSARDAKRNATEREQELMTRYGSGPIKMR